MKIVFRENDAVVPAQVHDVTIRCFHPAAPKLEPTTLRFVHVRLAT